MGIEFSGSTVTSPQLVTQILFAPECEWHFGLNYGNARAVLGLLGLPCDPQDCSGSCTLPEARRAILQARARFERKAGGFTREASTEARVGRAKVIRGALDEDGLKLRIDMFERFVDLMTTMQATHVHWI